jgi:hypothetical protein
VRITSLPTPLFYGGWGCGEEVPARSWGGGVAMSDVGQVSGNDAALLLEVAQHGQSEAARVSAANSIIDRGYGKLRQMGPETTPQVVKAEQDAEPASKAHAETPQLIDEMLAEFANKDEGRLRGNLRHAESSPLPQWTTGWDD